MKELAHQHKVGRVYVKAVVEFTLLDLMEVSKHSDDTVDFAHFQRLASAACLCLESLVMWMSGECTDSLGLPDNRYACPTAYQGGHGMGSVLSIFWLERFVKTLRVSTFCCSSLGASSGSIQHDSPAL